MIDIQKTAKQYTPAEQVIPIDRDGRRQYQPLSRDWVEMRQFAATGAATGVITFDDTDFIASEFFQKGDKVRCKQGGTFKYFYVVATATNTITVYGGDDYSLTAATVTNLATSRIQAPEGHPITFSYTPTATADSPMTGTTIPPNVVGNMYMVGNTVSIDGNIASITLGGTANTTISVTFPVAPSASSTRFGPVCDGTDAGSGVTIRQRLNFTSVRLVVSKTNNTNWTLGTASFIFNYQYEI